MHTDANWEIKLAHGDMRVIGDDGVIEGYASVFGNTDTGGDRVAPGAFRNSLIERPAEQVRMLWQHDPNEPIGVWEQISEDAYGLLVRGRILADVARGRCCHCCAQAPLTGCQSDSEPFVHGWMKAWGFARFWKLIYGKFPL